VAIWFEALGGEVEREDVYPGRPNTYGVWRGQTERWIAVDVHIDTVGIETMIGDPFDGRLENGRVYGRGSVDTKASLGVVLALLEDTRRRGEILKPNLVVCASSDEETGCGGAPVFAQWVHRRGLKLDQLLVAEPTMCAPIYGHKGSSNLIFEIQGEAAHSSKPHLGKNAIVAAAQLITALAAHDGEDHGVPFRVVRVVGSGATHLTLPQSVEGQFGEPCETLDLSAGLPNRQRPQRHPNRSQRRIRIDVARKADLERERISATRQIGGASSRRGLPRVAEQGLQSRVQWDRTSAESPVIAGGD
jgi:acetylornithine deacetylase/succinyl-diaminopimelate desuccinylase-like protein